MKNSSIFQEHNQYECVNAALAPDPQKHKNRHTEEPRKAFHLYSSDWLVPDASPAELLNKSLEVSLSLFQTIVGIKEVDKDLQILRNPNFDVSLFSTLIKLLEDCDKIARNIAKAKTT